MFNSIDLQNTFNELSSTLKSYSLTLDQISEDIKNFEEYLKSLHLLQDVRLVINRNYHYGEPKEVEAEILSFEFECVFKRDELQWDSRDKRLRFARYETKGGVIKLEYAEPKIEDVNNCYEWVEEAIILKPLIECKIEVRKNSHVYLSNFLKHVAIQLQNGLSQV